MNAALDRKRIPAQPGTGTRLRLCESGQKKQVVDRIWDSSEAIMTQAKVMEWVWETSADLGLADLLAVTPCLLCWERRPM